MVYEYLSTVPDEVRLVWRRKWTGLTVLFIINRYMTLSYAIATVSPYTSKVRVRNDLCIADHHLQLDILLVVSFQLVQSSVDDLNKAQMPSRHLSRQHGVQYHPCHHILWYVSKLLG